MEAKTNDVIGEMLSRSPWFLERAARLMRGAIELLQKARGEDATVDTMDAVDVLRNAFSIAHEQGNLFRPLFNRDSAWKKACELRKEFPSVEKSYTTQEVAELIGKYDTPDIISHINEALTRGST